MRYYQPIGRRLLYAVLAALVTFLAARHAIEWGIILVWLVLRLLLTTSVEFLRSSVVVRWEVLSNVAVAAAAGALLLVGPLDAVPSVALSAVLFAAGFMLAARPMVVVRDATLEVRGLGTVEVPRRDIEGVQVAHDRGGSCVQLIVAGGLRNLPIASRGVPLLRDQSLPKKAEQLKSWALADDQTT